MEYVDPLTLGPLERGAEGYVHEASGRRYPVRAGVPEFNVEELPLIDSTAPVHRDYGTTFHYRTHYQLDADYFDYFAAPPVPAWVDENRRLHEVILGHVPAAPATVLDVGCGNAWLAGALLQRDGYHVLSADVSTTNPRRALATYPSPRHEALVADAYFLPLPDASVDCVVAAEVIEHVPDPVAFVASLYRVLRPGGRVIVTTPYAQRLVYNMCVHCDRPTPQDAHIHHFDEGNVGRLVPSGARLYTERFNNHLLTKARAYKLTRRLPHGAWRRLDGLASRLFGKPARYLLRFDKPA